MVGVYLTRHHLDRFKQLRRIARPVFVPLLHLILDTKKTKGGAGNLPKDKVGMTVRKKSSPTFTKAYLANLLISTLRSLFHV